MHDAKTLAAELMAGLDGVTPGPWYQTGAPWFRSGDGVLAGSPDGNIAYLIADCENIHIDREAYEGPFELGDPKRDAAHIARCSPENIRTLCEGLAEAERERDEANLHFSNYAAVTDEKIEAQARELSALQEEAGRLREALEPFAEIAELDIGEDEHDLDLFRPMATHNRGPLLRVGLFRRARSALARTAGGKDAG